MPVQVSCLLFVLWAVLPEPFSEARAQGTAGILTVEETAWLANHPVIRRCPERGYAPFSFMDTDGKLKGISLDYVGLVEKKLGIKFQMMEGNNLAAILEQARGGEVDIVTSPMQTPERSEYLLFTRPYIIVPAVMLVRKGFEGVLDLDRAEKLTIAVGNKYAVQILSAGKIQTPAPCSRGR